MSDISPPYELVGVDGDHLGDVLLEWFGNNSPQPTGYSFAQIADCTNVIDSWIQRHYRQAIDDLYVRFREVERIAAMKTTGLANLQTIFEQRDQLKAENRELQKALILKSEPS